MHQRPIDFNVEAAAEASDARRWYANVNTTLGNEFVDELQSAITRIAAGPQRGANHLHGTRAMLVERFPYVIVYRILDDRVEVVAIQHVRRRPGYWRSRIRR